jgi:hypothetical protein
MVIKIQKYCGGVIAVAFAMFFYTSNAIAHGGVTIDQDRCVFQAEGHSIHFTAYQPSFSKTKELCRTINSVSDTILVIDFVEEALRKLSIELVLKKQIDDDSFVEQLVLDKKVYSTGTAKIAMTDVEDGIYRLYTNVQTAKHKHESKPSRQHGVGYFEFRIIDSIAVESDKNLLEKNKWVFYLLFLGLIIYFISKWYRNKPTKT